MSKKSEVIIKSLWPFIFFKLTFNDMLILNHFPPQWKCVRKITVIKPNKRENVVSIYRPIILLVSFIKIFEKMYGRRVRPVLEEHVIIPEHQFGFGNKSSEKPSNIKIIRVVDFLI